MKKIISRSLATAIRKQLKKFPILALTGPRQSGKTTLLKHLFPTYQYLSLENPDIRSFASTDPNGFLKQYHSSIILDEIQRVPELFSYLQTKVDESGKMGQFILTGSQNFHLVKNITQTLAGRIALFRLFPFDFQELVAESPLPEKYQESCFWGFYPAIYDRDIDPVVYYSNYIQTYIEKDVSDLINIRDLKSFRTFLSVCAGRSGQLLNLSTIAGECGISQPTAKSWLSVLESSYIIFLLQPYHNNFNKRLIKSPKLYFYDSGLLCNLLGFKDPEELSGSQIRGGIFETMIVAEMQKRNAHLYLHQDYYFWQDSNGKEIDVLTRNAGKFTAYEIKATETITPSSFKNLNSFEEMVAPQSVNKKLIYAGAENQKRTKLDIISWKSSKEY